MVTAAGFEPATIKLILAGWKPTELTTSPCRHYFTMVDPRGFEPRTYPLWADGSDQLSYGSKLKSYLGRNLDSLRRNQNIKYRET